MDITQTKIPGLFIIKPDINIDKRGFFMETYNKKKYEEIGINCNFVQDNMSFTKLKGTLRGLHFQNYPMSQAKLVTCTKGAVVDVAVDIRKGSPTYKHWIAVELSAENHRQFFIPKGFAHGFLTLTDNVEFQYKVDNLYSKEYDRGICFNDPSINIDWGKLLDGIDPILSKKDIENPLLEDSDCNYIYKENKI